MLRKLLWLFVVFPAGVVLVTFALANRHDVRLSLDPFSSSDPFLFLEAPFFLFLLGALLLGLLLGGFVTWLGQGKWRKAARQNTREADTLRAQNRLLDERLATATAREYDRAEAAE